ncbi:MAG TPA: tripartite tricarboxylate transporter substrate binding protein [Burkholderiales bacterium]|nr:tripartite tricarboxylate transporter substrate binding protein [Burkholderiales bacterium]
MNKCFAWIPASMALAFGFAANAQQAYPTRPVRVVVFVPAGGGADLLARVMGLKLGEALGQTVVIDNRAGMGGVVGTSVVAKAAPDGYTLLQGGITTHGIGPHIYTNLPYDPLKDFTPVILSATLPIFLVVNAQVPVKSVSELIALAKAKPGAVSFASPGTGSAPHLVGELFKIVTGIPSPHVPYKGSGTGAPALAAGEVQFMFDAIAGHQPFITLGRVKALAVTSPARLAAFPDIPTMKEVGLAKVEGTVWYGLLAPAGTPKPIIQKLNAESRRVLSMQEVKDRLTGAGIDAAGGTPEEFGNFIRAEFDKWGPVVKSAGVKAN